jgi:hypothetical protein
MLRATDCPHRKQFTPAAIRGTPIVTCALVNAYIGWMHGFPESFCERHCLAGSAEFPKAFEPGKDDSLNELAQAALASRLRDGRSDQDPTNPWRPESWQHCPRGAAVEKAKRCGMEQTAIAEAVVVAVSRGMAAHEAMELAKTHALVTR